VFVLLTVGWQAKIKTGNNADATAAAIFKAIAAAEAK
jgi:hypothetical protein